MPTPKVSVSKTDPARVSYRSSSGLYLRAVGYKVNDHGKRVPTTWVLTRDENESRVRAGKLDAFWRLLQAEGRTGEADVWPAEVLPVVEAIRLGKERVVIEPTPPGGTGFDGVYPNDLSTSVDGWRVDQLKNPVLPVVVRGRVQSGSGPTLHQALDTCARYVRENVLTAAEQGREQQVSAWGAGFARQVEALKRSHEDISLSQLDYAAIDRMAAYWERRPNKKGTDQPIRVKTVTNMLKALRRFLKWAARNYGWQPPQFWEDATKKRPKYTDAEKAAKKTPIQVRTFTPEQVGTLYKYATPFERLMLMLAICNGYGATEISTLQIDDLHLNPEGVSYIKRVRGKEVVYGEHWLAPELVSALEWALVRRKAQTRDGKGRDITWTATSKVILRDSGDELVKLTPAGNTSNKAANVWNGKLLKRVRKDFPDFPKLSFGKLRKTGANWIRHDRKYGGAEMATLFLVHGHSGENDQYLDNYTDRDFRRLFRAQRRVHRRKLKGIFATVTDPFPAERKKGGSNISLGAIERIRELDRQGVKPEEIMKATGRSRATVYRYIAPRKPRKPRSDRKAARPPGDAGSGLTTGAQSVTGG